MNDLTDVDPLDVVVAGLAVVDIIARPVEPGRLPKRGGLRLIDSITLTTGGNVCNCGIDLSKLGFRVGVIARVGRDGLGDFVRTRLASHSIVTDGIIMDDRDQTSATVVTVGRDGERSFLHTRGCLRSFRVRDVLARLPLIARARVFAFGYYGLLRECDKDLPRMFKTVKEHTGAHVLLDTGGSPVRKDRLMQSALPYIDYFVPSYDEAVACTGLRGPESIVRRFFRWGAPGVVGVKLGARGCYIAVRDRAAYLPARLVRRVVDATGAGDAFVSGFIGGILRGFDPFAAARMGNAVAASAVSAVGASTAVRAFDTYLPRTKQLKEEETRRP